MTHSSACYDTVLHVLHYSKTHSIPKHDVSDLVAEVRHSGFGDLHDTNGSAFSFEDTTI